MHHYCLLRHRWPKISRQPSGGSCARACQLAISRHPDRCPPSQSLDDPTAGTHRQHSVVEGAEFRRPWSSIVRVRHEVSCVCVLVAAAVAEKEVAMLPVEPGVTVML